MYNAEGKKVNLCIDQSLIILLLARRNTKLLFGGKDSKHSWMYIDLDQPVVYSSKITQLRAC